MTDAQRELSRQVRELNTPYVTKLVRFHSDRDLRKKLKAVKDFEDRSRKSSIMVGG